MACGSKTRETCGDVMYATCVDYEGMLGANTKITDECVTIEETTEDLYAITDEIISNYDTSGLGQLCMTYTLTDGSILPKTVFETHEQKICELDSALQALNNLEGVNISGWAVDFDCLQDACNNPIQTLGQWVQAATSAICDALLPTASQARIVSGAVAMGTLTLTRDDATTVDVDVSSLLDDTNQARVVSGSVVGNTLTLTRDDATSFDVDLSSLAGAVTSVDVQGGTGISTVGSPITSSGVITVNLDDSGVVAGSYNNPSNVVVNAQGQVTSITAGSGSGSVTETKGSILSNVSISNVGGTNTNLVDNTTTVNYIKVGNMVSFNASVTVSTPSLGSGGRTVFSLLLDTLPPFTPDSVVAFSAAFNLVEAENMDSFQGRISGTNLVVSVHKLNTEGTSSGSGNREVIISGTYITS